MAHMTIERSVETSDNKNSHDRLDDHLYPPRPRPMREDMKQGVPLDFCDDHTLRRREIAVSSKGGFSAYASLGPLARGHLLVVPRFRASAIAEATRYQIPNDDYREFERELVSFLTSQFGLHVVRYEHGSSDCAPRSTRCGTSQAHMHFLPIDADVIKCVSGGYLPFRPIFGFSKARKALHRGMDYLYISQESTEVMSSWEDIDDPGSQYIRRRLVHQYHASDSWDWSSVPEHNDVLPLADILREEFSKFAGRTLSPDRPDPNLLFSRTTWVY